MVFGKNNLIVFSKKVLAKKIKKDINELESKEKQKY